MKNYEIKLKDNFDEPSKGYLGRVAKLKVGDKTLDRMVKVSKYNLDKYTESNKFPLNEVFMRINLATIEDIDNDNVKRNNFVSSSLKPKTKPGKINIPLLAVETNTSPRKEQLQELTNFLLDIIYNNERIDLVVPPKLVLPEETTDQKKIQAFMSTLNLLSEGLKSYSSNTKIAFMIPDFFPRTAIPKLIECYINEFGADGILMLDLNGHTFSSIGYSITAQVIREMKTVHKEEDFAIYLFDHKSKKRSGKEVPSEDFLGFLNGASFIGGLHKFTPLPPYVIESLKQKTFMGKIFHKEDLLYYPSDVAPNGNDFNKFNQSQSNRFTALQIFNDIETNTQAMNISKSPDEVLDSLSKKDFTNVLKGISKEREKVVSQQPINDFL